MDIGRTLYLHIGHFKTGSSWIQSVLRLNNDVLLNHSLFYPVPADQHFQSPTFADSGNAMNLFSEIHNKRNILHTSANDKHLVLSSEFLFPQLKDEQCLSLLVEAANKAGIDRIEMLLLIRNPISLLVSGWTQAVKNSGEVEEIDKVVNNPSFRYYETPKEVAQLIELVEHYPKVRLKVRNYSTCRGDLLGVIADWLNTNCDFKGIDSKTIVNRSLTSGELLFQQTLNAELGACGDLCGNPLAEHLSHIRSSRIFPSLGAQKEYMSRMQPYMDLVNEKVEQAHHYRADLIEGDEKVGEPLLYAEQIKVIAGAIGTRISQERRDPSHVRTSRLLELLGQRIIKYVRNMYRK